MWAGGDPFGKCPECAVAGHAAAAFPCVPAVAGVDVYGGAVAVEADFEEPVGWGWPVVGAVFPFLLASLFVGDPPPGAVEVGLLDAFEEAQHVEPGQLFAHAFDSMIASTSRNREDPMGDPHTARIFNDLREVAAEVGLTVRTVPTEEFQEWGRRAWLARGRRFHITKSATGHPLASGWWAGEDAARDRFRVLVEEFGGLPGAIITLVDELERTTLAAWPEGLA